MGLIIFARTRPDRVIISAKIFGSIEALIRRIQAASRDIPQHYMCMVPYIATLLAPTALRPLV